MPACNLRLTSEIVNSLEEGRLGLDMPGHYLYTSPHCGECQDMSYETRYWTMMGTH